MYSAAPSLMQSSRAPQRLLLFLLATLIYCISWLPVKSYAGEFTRTGVGDTSKEACWVALWSAGGNGGPTEAGLTSDGVTQSCNCNSTKSTKGKTVWTCKGKVVLPDILVCVLPGDSYPLTGGRWGPAETDINLREGKLQKFASEAGADPKNWTPVKISRLSDSVLVIEAPNDACYPPDPNYFKPNEKAFNQYTIDLTNQTSETLGCKWPHTVTFNYYGKTVTEGQGNRIANGLGTCKLKPTPSGGAGDLSGLLSAGEFEQKQKDAERQRAAEEQERQAREGRDRLARQEAEKQRREAELKAQNDAKTQKTAQLVAIASSTVGGNGRYVLSGDDSIVDHATGLEWRSRTSRNGLSHNVAAEYCEKNGPGWRLPSISELQSLEDAGCSMRKGSECISALFDSNVTYGVWSNEKTDGSLFFSVLAGQASYREYYFKTINSDGRVSGMLNEAEVHALCVKN